MAKYYLFVSGIDYRTHNSKILAKATINGTLAKARAVAVKIVEQRDPKYVIKGEDVDAVLISTRPNAKDGAEMVVFWECDV